MTLNPNQHLSVVIPTYNRADFLNHSLELHIPILKKYNIQIFIFDNASTDNTTEVVSNWMDKYSLLYYVRNDFNLGADENFESALKRPDTDYIWLLGDTYIIREGTLSCVMSKLNERFDHILVNIGGEVINKPDKIYADQNELLYDLFWLMTCLSAHIYNRELIKHAQFERYRGTYFIQAGIVFEYINNKKFNICWISEHSVQRISEIKGAIKSTWMNHYFEIWISSRANFILSLPASYRLDAKLRSLKCISATGNGLGVRQIFAFRSHLILKPDTITKFYSPLKLTISNLDLLILIVCSRLPVKFFTYAKATYKLLKK
ncbi:glycosyltransferase [Pseudomonas sp. CF161]|uniref:glycosyltransferase family 2 protein n=1 Tax=Pseudomonas sp. CF161 TaxID=911241 RepID=UPI00035504D9|nr:glycosyltransferase [Pseudomonas sp. CF161]EPL08523.1 putative O antigen biosynthesis abequosyltransferase rfbV [Pseudomonas sp. CF161]